MIIFGRYFAKMKYMLLTGFFFAFYSVLISCNFTEGETKKPGKKIEYSYACLDSAVGGSDLNRALEKTTGIIRDIAIDEESITDELQTEYGNLFHQDAIETKTFILLNDEKIQKELEIIMNDLLAARKNPSRIKYSIYGLQDTAVNAFTFGGRIYVTKAMYDKCGGKTSLLYSIIGHEIGHSEKGHIKKTIQEMQLSEKLFGEDNGMTVFALKKLLTASFNQKNELEADYYGTDLSYNLDQDICSAVKFWKEMSKAENEYNKLEDFFRSHPFSSLRAVCLENHIRNNFQKDCN